jgi:ribosomal protein S18 acetylase RimI-like enzyme
MGGPEYIIRGAQAERDGLALNVMAREATDEAQDQYATRRRGSALLPSAFDSSVVLVAETTVDKRLVGFVALRITDTTEDAYKHAARHADITLLGVAPHMRRKGIGRDLVLSALKQAEAWKATRITLCVAEQNRAAISLYESMGWIVIDRMMTFPAKPPRADEP